MNNSVFLLVLIVSIVSCGAFLYQLSATNKLRRRFEAAFANLDSDQNLVDTITSYFDRLGATEARLNNIETSYKHLANIGAKSIQKTAIVRFNPFRNTGGDQSFVLAMLDNNDSGLLLTSIHSRDGTRVYIKTISYGNSEHNLSQEEAAALAQARSGEEAKK